MKDSMCLPLLWFISLRPASYGQKACVSPHLNIEILTPDCIRRWGFWAVLRSWGGNFRTQPRIASMKQTPDLAPWAYTFQSPKLMKNIVFVIHEPCGLWCFCYNGLNELRWPIEFLRFNHLLWSFSVSFSPSRWYTCWNSFLRKLMALLWIWGDGRGSVH